MYKYIYIYIYKCNKYIRYIYMHIPYWLFPELYATLAILYWLFHIGYSILSVAPPHVRGPRGRPQRGRGGLRSSESQAHGRAVAS